MSSLRTFIRSLVLLSFPCLAAAQVSIPAVNTAVTQDFNTLANSPDPGTSSVLPSGWTFSESGSNANTTYAIGTGSNNAGNTYSFGAAAAGDRAFGGLRSGSLVPILGASFTNNTGATITTLRISYRGELWRTGTINRTDRIDFQYSTNATSLTLGNYTDVDSLDYTSPQQTTTGAMDGNTINTIVTADITGLSIPPSGTFFIRWNDFDATGSDDGIGVDDFSIIANPGSGGGSPTNPSATVTASTVTAGSTTTFAGTVSPGSNPTSTSYTASCNLSAVGGSNSFALTVAGTTISGSYAVPAATAANTYSLPCTVTDDQTRSGNFNISLQVNAAPTLTCGPSGKTLIGAIQGSGTSGVAGTYVIQGTVIGAYQGTTRLNGFYVQDEGDGNPATSDGIFIDESSGSVAGTVSEGQIVRLQGTAAESFAQTVMNNITGFVSCGTGGTATPTDINFSTTTPLTAADFERWEGMLVRFPQQLRVTDNFNLGRFGEVTLAFVPPNLYGDGLTYTRLMTPTQVAAPGAPAISVRTLNSGLTILLDDGSNNTYANLAPTSTSPLDGGGLSATNTLRLGDRPNIDSNGTYNPIVGVLGFGFSNFRLQPVSASPISFNPSDNPRPASAPAVGGRVKVMSANVLNYFTDYQNNNSNAGPRGADNEAEFLRQRDKLISALKASDATVIALSELQNNSTTAIDNLVNGSPGTFANSLNAGNPGKWDYINTGVVGGDAIRVAFIYQPALVSPVGIYRILDDSVDSRALTGRNRPAIAQTFRRLGTRSDLQHFTVVANHFRSKGSACTSAPSDPNLNDEQDDCNLSRVSMAIAQTAWLAGNPTGDPTPAADRRFLLVGDLNAYSKEDPLLALTSTSFTKPVSAVFPSGISSNPNGIYRDLSFTLGDKSGYSYLFGGVSGSLDHALANPALFRLVTGVSEWHINADEPVVLDYNLDFDGNGSAGNTILKSAAQNAAYYTSGAFRTSDHDPILVGFNPLPGDLDDDGDVDAADQAIMRNAIGKPLATVDRRTDYDGDGRITLSDLNRWNQYQAAYNR